MSLEIAGRISLKVYFNNVELLIGYGTGITINKIHMVCSTRIHVPMIHMSITDNLDFLVNNKLLFDNCLITVIIGDQSAQSTTYEFRLNSFTNPNSVVSDSRIIELDGYLNLVKYWQSTSSESFTGTSSALLSNIASKCSLNYIGDNTSDSQTWFPRNMPFYEWARSSSERGFKSQTSCMQLGIDISKTMIYTDIASRENPVRNISIGKPKPGFLYAMDASPSSSPGAKNNLSGYSSSLIEQDLMTTEKVTVEGIKLLKGSERRSLTINTSVKELAGMGRVRFSPIDPGNVHPKYEQAMYQNRRIANLYVNKLEVIVNEPSKLKLLDSVTVHLDNEHRNIDKLGGNYRLTSRVVYFNGIDYMEKLELAARSVAYVSENLVTG